MNSYYSIVEHYENCFARFGDSPQGLDWPNMQDLVKRYDVMLDVVRDRNAQSSLLDFGCGTGMLYEHLRRRSFAAHIEYSGLDLSSAFVQQCQQKFPRLTFYWLDVIKNPEALPLFDYIVMNGVFTEKRELQFGEMFEYFTNVLKILFTKARVGIAFNVMSKHVQWERDDLFHLSMDVLGEFLTLYLTRNFVIRNDYGLFEYTTYAYK